MIEFTTVLAVLLMILLPVTLAARLRRGGAAPWILFTIGSLTFILSQAVHIPLNDLLVRIGLLSSPDGLAGPVWRDALLLGLTAGLCEELMRAVGFAVLQRFQPGWLRFRDAVMLGLGHGGIEAMILGGVLTAASISALLPLRSADLQSLGLTADQVAALQVQLNALAAAPYAPLIALLERVLALTAHVIFSVIVWRAFAGAPNRRGWIFIAAAVLYHAFLDAAAVYAIRTWPEIGYGIEAVFAVIVLPGAIWLARVWRNAGEGVEAGESPEPLPTGGRIFLVAARKELLQLWRTKRVLVVTAVFLLFGMGSPLLAKLTPTLLNSIEGAQQFADLIPEPTAGDAMAQYLKNLTQFGFLIVILVGMGAVAGERERGITPMILSKPMPRWAFLVSKFTAHFLMYAGALLLAGLGAYYYTAILFDAPGFGPFALLNGLLLLWLSVYLAATLLGSTIAGTTAAAGGIGFGLSALLLIAGSLPKIGALLPGGLIAWATQLGLAAAGTAPSALSGVGAASGGPNGGAAAAALVLIVWMLVLSVGVFEQKEL